MQKSLKDQLDYSAVLRGVWRRHKRLTVLAFVAVAAPLLFLVYQISQPLFEASATIILDASPVERLPYFRDVNKDNSVTYALVLQSRSLSEGVVEALPKESFQELLDNPLYVDYPGLAINTVRGWLGHPAPVASPQARALSELRNGRMQFTPSQANRVISIKAVASSPRVAMDLVNTHIQVLLSRTRNTDQDDAKKMRDFLERQTQSARDQLAQSELTVTRFQQQKGRLSLGSQTELDLAKLSQTESALAEAQASRQVLGARAAALRDVLNKGTREARAAAEAVERDRDREDSATRRAQQLQTQMENFRRSQDRLQQLENKLATLRERFTEAHPMVAVTREEVASEQARIARMARELPAVPKDAAGRAAVAAIGPTVDRSDIQRQLVSLEAEDAGLQSRIQTLQAQVAQLRRGIQSLSQDELQFGNLLRNVEAQRNLVAVFQDKLMAARMRDGGSQASIRIVDAASFPLQATHARTMKYGLLALAFSAGFALLLSFGVEVFRQPVETESDVQKAAGLPVLGSIGVIEAKGPVKRRRQEAHLPLHIAFTASNPDIHTDLYRAIRAAIETEALKTPFRSILVSSPGPGEGKSTTTLNLAHVFQEFGRRVLVIDADLRRPSLHRALGFTNKPGLVDYLTGSATFDEITRPLPSGVVVIPSQFTRQDAGSLLASPRLKELLVRTREQFDLVLVDSAPLLAVPDNLLLLTQVERVVLVARASHTGKRDLQRAQELAAHAGAKVLGVILNQAQRHDIPYFRARYRRYYRVPEQRPAPEPRLALPAGRK